MKKFRIKGTTKEVFLEAKDKTDAKEIFPIIYGEEVIYICEIDDNFQDIKGE